MTVTFTASLAATSSAVRFDAEGGGRMQLDFPLGEEEQVYELLRFARERPLRVTVEVEDSGP